MNKVNVTSARGCNVHQCSHHSLAHCNCAQCCRDRALWNKTHSQHDGGFIEHKPTALGIPTRSRSPISLKEQKNCCTVCMHFSDSWRRPIPRGIVPKPLALANNCVPQQARTVLISSPLHFPLSQLSSVAHPHWPLPEFLGQARQDRLRSCSRGSQSPPTCVLASPRALVSISYHLKLICCVSVSSVLFVP